MKNKRIRTLTQSCRSLLLALSALALPDAPSWALGSNAASFTYTGDQQGFTTGTVYTLSTDSQSLGFCQLAPSATANSGYSAQCFTNYGNTNSDLYSAVAYLGTVNNPNNQFVVGAGNGALYLTQLNFEPSDGSYVVPGLTMTTLPQGCPSGSQVFSLAVDPNGQYLYVGCSDTTSQETHYGSQYMLPTYLLYSVPINADGTLGTFESVTGLFDVFADSSSWTAGVWPGVSPVIRAYPANSPNLGNTPYSVSGAVMVSGLVGGLSDNDTANHAPGPVPASSGVICSNGTCQVAYSFNQAASSSFSVFTAAEVGVDYYNGNYEPALYWNQVAGDWDCIDIDPVNGLCLAYGGYIPWDKTGNTIWSCNLANNPIGGPTMGVCGADSYALDWTPNGMPAAGNGLQVDISNLLYVPAPSNVSTPFIEGLLTIGTWSNGYLAYHSPATQNSSTAMFMAGNGSNGQVGNVNSLLGDVNGNLLYGTSTSGLFVFNPFAGSNTANGSDITLIPNTADSSGSGGEAENILTGVEIAYYSVRTIATVAALGTTEIKAAVAGAVPDTDLAGLNSGLALGRVLGHESYRGQFLYTEAQLREMGLENGAMIRGVRLRSSQGITPDSENSTVLKSCQIALSQGKSMEGSDDLDLRFGKNIGKQRKLVQKGSLTLGEGSLPPNKVYPGSPDEGTFGKTIWFDRPYGYRGGNLLMEISHRGRGDTDQFLIDAFGTLGLQGIYMPLKKGGEARAIRSVPALEFVY